MSAGSTESPVLDFTSLDYASAVADIARFVQSRTGTRFTNLNPSDPFVVLQQTLAYLTDLLAYTENAHVRESIPTLAVRKNNFVNATRGMGFVPKGRSPGQTRLTVTLDPAVLAVGSITVTTHHKFGTRTGMIFQPVSTVVFPFGGSTTGTIDVIQGEEVEGEILASASPGTENQSYLLLRSPVLEDSLALTVGGLAWTQVRTVALSLAGAREYSVTSDEDGVCTVTFGDGVNGAIPPAGQAVVVSYKVGGGEDTNVDHDEINQLTDAPVGVLTCTNLERAEGGTPAETLSAAKARLPGAVRANDRGVSTPDYAALACQISGIEKAVAVSGPAGTGGCGTSVVVYAAPAGGFSGGGLTPAHRAQILSNVREKAVTGKKVFVRTAEYGNLVIDLDVFVLAGTTSSDVKALVQNAVLDEFDFTSTNFGVSLSVQSLYDLLLPSRIRGISRVRVKTFSVTPYFSTYMGSTPTGNGGISNPGITNDTLRREWHILITDGGGSSGPAEFQVTERVLCTATEVSDTTVRDEAAAFTTNGLVTASSGWTLRYSPYEGSGGVRDIEGNTGTSISVAGGDLQDVLQAGDLFVVEKAQVAAGKCYRNAWTAPSGGYAAGTTLAAPGSGWATGDKVRLVTSSGLNVEVTVTGGSTGAWTVTPAVAAIPAGTTITADAVFVTADGTLTFVLNQGSRRWVVGDQGYVDAYPQLDDVTFRPSVYPYLAASALSIRAVGGRT